MSLAGRVWIRAWKAIFLVLCESRSSLFAGAMLLALGIPVARLDANHQITQEKKKEERTAFNATWSQAEIYALDAKRASSWASVYYLAHQLSESPVAKTFISEEIEQNRATASARHMAERAIAENRLLLSEEQIGIVSQYVDLQTQLLHSLSQKSTDMAVSKRYIDAAENLRMAAAETMQ